MTRKSSIFCWPEYLWTTVTGCKLQKRLHVFEVYLRPLLAADVWFISIFNGQHELLSDLAKSAERGGPTLVLGE